MYGGKEARVVEYCKVGAIKVLFKQDDLNLDLHDQPAGRARMTAMIGKREKT